MPNAINETLIRDVIEEVLGRLGGSASTAAPQPRANSQPAVSKPDCQCHQSRNANSSSGTNGVFDDINRACDAAAGAFVKLQKGGIAARQKVIDIVKGLCDANAVEWGRIELEETKIGRLDH